MELQTQTHPLMTGQTMGSAFGLVREGCPPAADILVGEADGTRIFNSCVTLHALFFKGSKATAEWFWESP